MAQAIDLRGLVRPALVEATKRDDNPNIAEFRLQPLERGFGHTLGNAMRRMLLSSLRGSAVWAFRIDGVLHEHQTIQGVVEDVHQIIGNLKMLTLILDDDVEEVILRITKGASGPVTAADIQAAPGVTVLHPSHHLFTLQDDRDINVELYVNKGRGYVEADQHTVDRALPVDVVRIDSIYNPVRRANFSVAETRVGQRTDYDRLTLNVETNVGAANAPPPIDLSIAGLPPRSETARSASPSRLKSPAVAAVAGVEVTTFVTAGRKPPEPVLGRRSTVAGDSRTTATSGQVSPVKSPTTNAMMFTPAAICVGAPSAPTPSFMST